MKNGLKNKNNFTDALAMDVRYAVLTKERRIQILIKPSAKQLRKRGKRGWHLFSTIDSGVDSASLLNDAVARALSEGEHRDEPAATKERKDKSSKTKMAAVTG